MNMSYCAAENTALAIDQLIGLIQEGQKSPEECSDRELRAMKRLAQGLVEELTWVVNDWATDHEDEL